MCANIVPQLALRNQQGDCGAFVLFCRAILYEVMMSGSAYNTVPLVVE
jgi:hypothetical protein